MNEKEEKTDIEVLLHEHESVSQGIRSQIESNEKIMSLGLTVLGAGTVYGLKEKINEMFFLLPIGVFGLMLYTIFINTVAMSYGGYKQYLEERINALLRKKLL